jgi:acid phosphatase
MNTKTTTLLTALAATGLLTSCTSVDNAPADTTAALRTKVQTIVVIYAENRSFDNLYGNFPGANGLTQLVDGNGQPTSAYVVQKDRDGVTPLATLPQTWGGLTARGVTPVVTQAQSAGLPNRPFALETAFERSAGAKLTTATTTRDLYHRFFENQMQINGGRNDMFAAWADGVA